MQESLASQITLVSFFGSNIFKIGAEHNADFNALKLKTCSSPQENGTFFLVNLTKAAAVSENLGTNLL